MKTAIAPLLLPLKEALNTANTEMKSMKSQLAGKESTITSMAREIADLQWPISLTIFPSQFKFDGNFTSTKFGTCHDSPAVVPCAKYCSDHFISIWIGAKWNFHHIWIVMEKLLVKWAPSLQWWPRAAGQKGICEGLWGTQNHRGHYRHQNPIWPRQTDDPPPPRSSLRIRRLSTVSAQDDVIKWKLSPRYWPLVRRIHRSPVNSPHKGQWRGALMISLIFAWINSWVNNHEAGDLRRHRVHYDIIVMYCWSLILIEGQ